MLADSTLAARSPWAISAYPQGQLWVNIQDQSAIVQVLCYVIMLSATFIFFMLHFRDATENRDHGGLLYEFRSRCTADVSLRTTVRKTARCRERIEPPLSQQMRREGQRTEYLNKGGAADIEPARISPEGRHHQACFVADETPSCQGASPPADARHRMQMARDFTRVCLRGRLMTK